MFYECKLSIKRKYLLKLDMAFNLKDRFPQDPPYYPFYDPGTYQHTESSEIKPSKFPFLSNTPRVTQPGRKIWTRAIYDSNLPKRIPNCSSMMSKIPRFPYEAFSQEDLEEILCKCGIQICECPDAGEAQEEKIVCEGKKPRGIHKGSPKRFGGDGSLSAPSKGDRGFKLLPDGTKIRVRDVLIDESPPFYDTRVNESTAFYHGCKWSKWTGNREAKSLEQRPGPADYTLEHEPTYYEICAEKVRSHKRKTSKQYRFIEEVQRRNILEGAPGPATYSPQSPRGTEMQYLGSKGERFPTSKYTVHPGPADHFLRRDFDPTLCPLDKPCHATLPERACFGMKDTRFKPLKEFGPSPASYDIKYQPCKFVKCPTTPFGSAAVRFKPDPVQDYDDDLIVSDETTNEEKDNMKVCPSPTWGFKSKTVRMKPLVKQWHEPSPADFGLPRSDKRRPLLLQYLAPFHSSEGRMQPWFNYLPVHGKYVTPGPCYYNAEKPRCQSAVPRNSLCRSQRFPTTIFQTPAPNEYKIGRGVETVLFTHNKRLKNNVMNRNQFNWVPPPEKTNLTLEDQELLLLNKCIAICDVPDEAPDPPLPPDTEIDTVPVKPKEKTKMLRCFLYRHQMPICS